MSAFWKIVEKLCWLSGVQKNNIFYNKPTFYDIDGTSQERNVLYIYKYLYETWFIQYPDAVQYFSGRRLRKYHKGID